MDKATTILSFFSEKRNREIATQFHNCIDPLMRECIHKAGVRHDVEDFHSQMREKLLTLPPTIYKDQGKPFEGWLYPVVKNTFFHNVRDQRHELTEFLPELHDRVDEESDVYERERLYQALHDAISQLKDIYQDVIREFYFNNKTQAEVCETLGIRLCTLNKRRRVALQQLRRILKSMLD